MAELHRCINDPGEGGSQIGIKFISGSMHQGRTYHCAVGIFASGVQFPSFDLRQCYILQSCCIERPLDVQSKKLTVLPNVVKRFAGCPCFVVGDMSSSAYNGNSGRAFLWVQRFLAAGSPSGSGRVRNSRSSRWFRTDLWTRSWAADLSTAEYLTDPEKSYLLSATVRNPFGSHNWCVTRASLYPHVTETKKILSNGRKTQALRLQQFTT